MPRPALPSVAVPLPGVVTAALLYLGTAGCALSLALISAGGFAPDGRPPLTAVLLFAAGALFVALRPRDTSQYTSRT